MLVEEDFAGGKVAIDGDLENIEAAVEGGGVQAEEGVVGCFG